MSILELIGWAGALTLLTGFVLNIFKIIDANSILYLLLNAIGSTFLLYNAWVNQAFPFVVVNFTWIVFSLVRLIQKIR